MTRSQVEYAERKAMELFDKWNDVTGVVQPCTSYYDEIRSLIEDAVHIGIQMAVNGKVNIKDGELIRE